MTHVLLWKTEKKENLGVRLRSMSRVKRLMDLKQNAQPLARLQTVPLDSTGWQKQ